MSITTPSNVIEINKLLFRWDSRSEPVLNIDQLFVNRGESLFIEGPSGCGKSSLLNLIAAVITPDSGTLQILGQHLSEVKGAAKDRFRADHIGIIFQQFNLVPYLSVSENIALPCSFSSARKSNINNLDLEIDRLLTSLGIDISQFRNKPVTELSVGQQQRVAAARALIGAPEIIIADEPTSALDSDSRQVFIELLFQECKNANSTLIFVSHDHSLAGYFDRVIHLPTINRIEISANKIAQNVISGK